MNSADGSPKLTFSAAHAQLRSAQKGGTGVPAYSRFVNRPLGRVFAAAGYRLGLSPNQITLISALCTFSGIALIALVDPSLPSSLLVSLLLVLGYALDSADGQVARLTGGGSLAGEWLDHAVDAFKMSTVHVAVLICWARFYSLDSGWLLIPLAFQVVSTVFFALVLLADLLRRVGGASNAKPAPADPRSARNSPLYSLAVLPADYGFLALSFVLLWAQPVFTAVYTAIGALTALMLIASCVRWYRAMRRLDVHR